MKNVTQKVSAFLVTLMASILHLITPCHLGGNHPVLHMHLLNTHTTQKLLDPFKQTIRKFCKGAVVGGMRLRRHLELFSTI